MINLRSRPTQTLLVFVLATLGFAHMCTAQVVPVSASQPVTGDFSVVTTVRTAPDPDPIAKHRVVFRGGIVYDLRLLADRYVTVYDEGKRRVVLLDRTTHVKTTLGTDDLLKRTARARTTEQDPAKRLKLGLGAEVKRSDDAYSIAFGTVTYTTTSHRPSSPAIALSFARFADWAMRLNIACGSPVPPFARMSLNAEMGKDGVLPSDLQITSGAKVFSFSHELVESLTPDDHRRVDEVDSMLLMYRDVPYAKFPTE